MPGDQLKGLKVLFFHLLCVSAALCVKFVSFVLTFDCDCQLSCMERRLFCGNDLNNELPFAWPVEFAKEDSLPTPQRQPAFFNEHDLAAADKH